MINRGLYYPILKNWRKTTHGKLRLDRNLNIKFDFTIWGSDNITENTAFYRGIKIYS